MLDGHRFLGINGGPQFPFTEAVSFEVRCADQAEVDYYWSSLVEGGEESQCGWLKDRYGLSWQIVPERLYELIEDPDPGARRRGDHRDAGHAQDRGGRARRCGRQPVESRRAHRQMAGPSRSSASLMMYP